jgi:hypothetical protein
LTVDPDEGRKRAVRLGADYKNDLAEKMSPAAVAKERFQPGADQAGTSS